MSLALDHSPLPSVREELRRRFARRRLIAVLIPAGLLAYLAYVFVAFDVAGIASRARPENAAILLSDFWSFKTHVSRDNRDGSVVVAIEGENKGTYPTGMSPDWVQLGDVTRIAAPDGSVVTYDGPVTIARIAGFGTVTLTLDGRNVALTLPEGVTEAPAWMNVARNRVSLDRGEWRLSVTRNRTETFVYEPGWELFWFTLDSPFYGRSALELAELALSGDRLVPDHSNLVAMVSDFWNNRMWRHGDVFWAMGETVLMAFLGTMGAGLIALPLAFLAASNFSPRVVRLPLRRLFDFLRGVDGLIWTVILSRAFGPGPLTGSLAMLLTDTGSFGKTFSEALENIDGKQVEGVASTGANALQRARFGVIPQVAPVILSQLLYFLESNTRSATVIGALVGGGIGLLLTNAIITQKDWEEVCWYIILIVLMVMAMDSFSGWLRRKLIKG